jgi:Nuclear fragile X mental retardation-interacting protein 1 (NUFIP1)/Zinc finger C-x8-C-x5-C-x3-H type (and similar)
MAPFSFPPPPPPPPTQQHPPPPGLGNTTPYASQNAYSHRGNYRGSGGGYRGRGRGGVNRGGRGGGAYPNSYSNNNQQNVYGGGYPNVPAQPPVNTQEYYQNGSPVPYPPASYPPVAQGYAQSYASPSTTTTTTAYPHTNYNGSYGNTGQAVANAPAQSYPAGSTGHSSTVVAPPMHWNAGAGGFYPGSTNGTSFQYQGSTHGAPYGGGQKRAFSSAFGKPVSQVPRVAAPPAVPSFGVPLPAKPPQPADNSRKALKKKKRKFNQLGLTPKTEEHESSAEEDDVDEESRLASADNAAGPIQVTYRGRTSTLNTTADIQAWIAERKKRFPTEARVEEKKKAQEEAKKQRELQREEARRKQLELKEQAQKVKKQEPSSAVDVAIRAKAKAEKLRKKLLKEEKRLQKAEADAEKARLVVEASQQPSNGVPSNTEALGTAENIEGDVDQSTVDGVPSQTDPDPSANEGPSIPKMTHTDNGEDNLPGISDSSISSGEDSEDDDDDMPEEISSRRDGPERVPPPPREGNTKSSKPCRDFQRKGKCPRGTQCRFSHEPRTKQQQQQPRQPAKRGLYQMVCLSSPFPRIRNS